MFRGLRGTNAEQCRVAVPVTCGRRLCEPCGVHREMVQRARTFALVQEAQQRAPGAEGGRNLRVIVLTLRNAPLGKLAAMGAAMDEGLKNLRRTAAWRAKVAGGKLAFEVTGSVENGWHLHANVIVEGTYWAQAELAAAWQKATDGAGEIVWIEGLPREGQTLEDGVREAVKYFVKFREAEEKWPVEMKAEFERWAHGRAFYRTYGIWRGAAGAKDWSPVQEASALSWNEGGCPVCKTLHGWKVSEEAPFLQFSDLAAFGYSRWGFPPVKPPPEPPPARSPGARDEEFFEELQLARERPRRAKFECEADFEHARIEGALDP